MFAQIRKSLIYLSLSIIKEILDYIMGFSAEGGNIDCIHPAQCILDFLCGANNLTYATQLESFFEGYAAMRGIKSKIFKPLKSCVWGLAYWKNTFNIMWIRRTLIIITFVIQNNAAETMGDTNYCSQIFSRPLIPKTACMPGLYLRPLMLQAATTPWSCRWHVELLWQKHAELLSCKQVG